MEKSRETAIKILAEFEELLDKKGLKIPSDDRTGEKEEACLYGTEYYTIEDRITEILDKKNSDERTALRDVLAYFDEKENNLLQLNTEPQWDVDYIRNTIENVLSIKKE
jgi:hypothetical protein